MTPTSTLATLLDALVGQLVNIVVFVVENYWGYLVIFAIAAGIATYLLVKGKHIAGGK